MSRAHKANPGTAGTVRGAGGNPALCRSATASTLPTDAPGRPARIERIVQLPGVDQWRVTLCGGTTLTVPTRALQSHGRFRTYAAVHGVQLAPLRDDHWLTLLDEALRPLREARRPVSS